MAKQNGKCKENVKKVEKQVPAKTERVWKFENLFVLEKSQQVGKNVGSFLPPDFAHSGTFCVFGTPIKGDA